MDDRMRDERQEHRIRADNFKTLADMAPHDCKIEMAFGFNGSYTLMEFLQKINIPQLFKNLEFSWQWIKIKFRCHGMSHSHVVIDRLIPLNPDFNFNRYHLYEASELICKEFAAACQYHYMETPIIEQMILSF